MKFENPIFLLPALACVPWAAFFWFRRRNFQKFASPKDGFCAVLRFFSWICLCAALSRPVFGTKIVAQKKSGNFVAIVADVSQSMNATDENLGESEVSRLEAAKNFAANFLKKAKSASFALVAAKGGAQILLPLTGDFFALESAVRVLSPMSAGMAGTNLSAGIDEAFSAVSGAKSGNRGILCLTDGEELSGDAHKAALRAAECGIKIAFVGFGSENGREILAGDGKTRVFSALQSEKLAKIASISGGIFVKGGEKNGFERVFDFLIENPDENSDFFTDFVEIPAERWRIFALASIFFFFLSKILACANFGKIAFFSFACAIFSACSADFRAQTSLAAGVFKSAKGDFSQASADFLQSAQTAQDAETAAFAKFNLGAAFLQAGEKAAAKNVFSTLREADFQKIRFAANYNLGCIFAQEGEFEDAARCFRTALEIEPQNEKAKINLDLAQKSREKSRKNGKSAQISGGNSEKNDEIFEILQKEGENRWKSVRNPCAESPLDY